MELLTVDEVAQNLRVHPITVRRYIAAGQMAAVRVGRSIRIPKESLDAFVKPFQPKPGKLSSRTRGKASTKDDPLMGLVGIGRSGVGDISENKHEYLAEAYQTKGE